MVWGVGGVWLYGFAVVAFDAMWLWFGERSWPVRSSLAITGSWACGVFGFMQVIEELWLAFPFLVGVFMGNLLVAMWKRRSEELGG